MVLLSNLEEGWKRRIYSHIPTGLAEKSAIQPRSQSSRTLIGTDAYWPGCTGCIRMECYMVDNQNKQGSAT